MGAKVEEEDGIFKLDVDNLHGIDIFFDFPSVGRR